MRILTNNTFVSHIYTFSSVANIIVYTPSQGTKREKYFNYNFSKGKMPTLSGNKHLSIHFFPHRPRLFRFSTENIRAQSIWNGQQGAHSRADTMIINTEDRSNVFHNCNWEFLKMTHELVTAKIKKYTKKFSISFSSTRRMHINSLNKF